jgi:hypothetical protein
MARAEFTPPRRDQAWLDLRERLGRAARETHFSATSPGTSHGAVLLAIAGNLAALAMSIPLGPAQPSPSQLVEASTLLAAQLLQHRKLRDDSGRKQITGPAAHV